MKTNKEIITEIITDLEKTVGLVWSTGNRQTKVTREKLINCWSIHYKEKEYEFYDVIASSYSRALRRIFTNLNKPQGCERYKSYVLRLYEYKYCSNCKTILKLDNFHVDKQTPSGYRSHCQNCVTEYNKTPRVKALHKDTRIKRKFREIQQTPRWADFNKMEEFQLNCPEGMHVDHIIPLKGKKVSGLNVDYNLQYLDAKENYSKSNKYEVE